VIAPIKYDLDEVNGCLSLPWKWGTIFPVRRGSAGFNNLVFLIYFWDYSTIKSVPQTSLTNWSYSP